MPKTEDGGFIFDDSGLCPYSVDDESRKEYIVKRETIEIKQYDTVLLKDGREADIMEVLDDKTFIADVGSSPKDWETIDITIDDIEKVI